MELYRFDRVPMDGPSYRELEKTIIRLQGNLDEAREQQKVTEHFAMLCVFLFAATATLLVLTWSGKIVI